MKSIGKITIGVACVLMLSGCGELGSGGDDPTPEPTQPVQTATATPDESQPAAPNSPAPATPSEPTDEPEPAIESRQIAAYYILIDDGGRFGYKVGCGDSVVPVYQHANVSAVPVKESLDFLLSFKGEYYQDSGYYNALHQSDLRTVSAHIDPASDTVHVYLEGDLQLSGVCDVPRAEQQIAFTAAHAAETTWAKVYLNGKSFDEVTSAR